MWDGLTGPAAFWDPLTPAPPCPPPPSSPFTTPPSPAPPTSRPSQHSDIIITRVWPLISNVNIFHIDECAVYPHCAQNGLQPSSGHESLLCHTPTHPHTDMYLTTHRYTEHMQSHSHTMHTSVSTQTYKCITNTFFSLAHLHIFSLRHTLMSINQLWPPCSTAHFPVHLHTQTNWQAHISPLRVSDESKRSASLVDWLQALILCVFVSLCIYYTCIVCVYL